MSIDLTELETRGACRGNATLNDGDMERCAVCDRGVAWDLTEHPFFGFAASCERHVVTDGADK